MAKTEATLCGRHGRTPGPCYGLERAERCASRAMRLCRKEKTNRTHGRRHWHASAQPYVCAAHGRIWKERPQVLVVVFPEGGIGDGRGKAPRFVCKGCLHVLITGLGPGCEQRTAPPRVREELCGGPRGCSGGCDYRALLGCCPGAILGVRFQPSPAELSRHRVPRLYRRAGP